MGFPFLEKNPNFKSAGKWSKMAFFVNFSHFGALKTPILPIFAIFEIFREVASADRKKITFPDRCRRPHHTIIFYPRMYAGVCKV